MKRNITRMVLAAAIAIGFSGAAFAGQFGPMYMFCHTPFGNGPVLMRPAHWLGNSCWMPGPVQGYWVPFY